MHYTRHTKKVVIRYLVKSKYFEIYKQEGKNKKKKHITHTHKHKSFFLFSKIFTMEKAFSNYMELEEFVLNLETRGREIHPNIV